MMIKQEEWKMICKLGDAIRRGEHPDDGTYERLAEGYRGRHGRPPRKINNWWDLPVAEMMWQADAREDER